MKNILVPLGASPSAQDTLQYAVNFAAEFDAKLYIIDVFALIKKAGSLGNVEQKMVESKVKSAKEVIEAIDTKGVSIQLISYKGEIVEAVNKLEKELSIDLMILAPKSNEVNETLYLGRTTGSIIKQTNIPTLIVPKQTSYAPFKNILVAFKSGVLKRSRVLHPLIELRTKFNPLINLLLVKTPGYTDEDLQVNTALLDVSRNLTISDNQTTYHGVLEHFQTKNPDLLCVFRRKRGFFKKLWEKNTILKSEFYAPIPVLVLSVKK